MTKNADFGPNLAVFGPKSLIFMGLSKSFGTNITENHLDNLFASFFGQALDHVSRGRTDYDCWWWGLVGNQDPQNRKTSYKNYPSPCSVPEWKNEKVPTSQSELSCLKKFSIKKSPCILVVSLKSSFHRVLSLERFTMREEWNSLPEWVSVYKSWEDSVEAHSKVVLHLVFFFAL